MPLHPPAGSALTSPVYFGVRLNSARMCTPELLRAHLQTVRQVLQCDFIVIPTASDSSLEASEGSASQQARYGMKKFTEAKRNAEVARDTSFVSTESEDTVASSRHPGTSHPIRVSSLVHREKSLLHGPEKPPTVRHPCNHECSCAGPTPTADSSLLVESPTYATGRATIPVQHLADAAVDFPAFCRSYVAPSGKCFIRENEGSTCESDATTVEMPVDRTEMPSFCAVDGGLAALPATYAFAPSHESDLALDSQTWNAAVVCELSAWISPDVGVVPRWRKVATSSRASRSGYSARHRKSDSAAGYISAAAEGSLAATNSEVPYAPYNSQHHSPPLSSDHPHATTPETAAKPAAGRKICDREARQWPVVTSAEPVAQASTSCDVQAEGHHHEEQTPYNKRSRTTAARRDAGHPAKNDVNGVESDTMTQETEQPHTSRRAAEQLQHTEAARWPAESHTREMAKPAAGQGSKLDGEVGGEDGSYGTTSITEATGAEVGGESGNCSNSGGAADAAVPPPPNKCVPSASFRLPPPCSSDTVHAEVTVAETTTVDRSAATSAQHRKHLAAKRDEKQLQLEKGLLRHWSFHERAWQREMQWATHVGAFAIITPPPAPDMKPVEYSRLLRAALDQLQPPIIWIKLPLVYTKVKRRSRRRSSNSRWLTGETRRSSLSCNSERTNTTTSNESGTSNSSSSERIEPEDGEDSTGGQNPAVCHSRCRCYRRNSGRMRHKKNRQVSREEDPWQLWQYIRSMVGPHPSLGLCLEMTLDLPDSDSELERWFAEPLRAVMLSPSLFTSSTSCGGSSSAPPVSTSRAVTGGSLDSQHVGESTRTLNKYSIPYKTAAHKSAGAPPADPGVCLSPRHHLFLLKCAQHRVKIIFQFDEEEDKKEIQEMEVPPALEAIAAGKAAGTPGKGSSVPDKPQAAGAERSSVEKLGTSRSSAFTNSERSTCQQIGLSGTNDFPSLSRAVHAITKEKKASLSGTSTTQTLDKKTGEMPLCCNRRAIAALKGQKPAGSAPPLEEMQPYISYVAQQLLQLPALKQTELFSAPYRDVLQAPMQPLADNLSAVNYEVFEKDPVKYLRYKEATLLRLREIWPGAATEHQRQQRQRRVKVDEAARHAEESAAVGQYCSRTKLPQTQEQQQGEHKTAIDQSLGAVANEISAGHAFPPAVEIQKRRKKNRGRRRGGRPAARKSAYKWDCGSDDAEEEALEEGAAAFFDTSFGAASSKTPSLSIPYLSSSSSPSSGRYPPPPPVASAAFPAGTGCGSMVASEWCLRGADCTLHAAAGPRLVLTIVGAGRGPLVQAALEALREACIPLCRVRVFAVEKNWNAVITLRNRVRSDACIGWRTVEVVEADMREAGDCVAERADILISELLGSFGDNELSAECLDGAQMRLLKKDGVSIPSACVSSMEPVSTHTLWQAIDSYNDPKQFECAYVVNMFAKYFPAKEGPKECFHYRHPHFLLPFGDDDGGSSTSSSGDDRSSTISSDRCRDESRSSDSRANIDNRDGSSSRQNGGSRGKEIVFCSNGGSTRRKDVEARGRNDKKEGEQGTDAQRETCKRHEVSPGAPAAYFLHVKQAAGGDAHGSTSPADSASPVQNAGRHAPAVARTGSTRDAENLGVVEGTGESRYSQKLPACGGGSSLRVRGERGNKKNTSLKTRSRFTAAELTVLRHRRTRLAWRMRTDTVVHGLAGYFHCCLYKSVYISIDPRSFSEGMFSWFPLFLPFRQPVYVSRNEKLEVYIARDGDEHKVWYEWAVLRPTPSQIYNHMGKYSYIGK